MGKFRDIIINAYKRMGEVDVPNSEGADYTAFINNVDEKKILEDAMAEIKRMENNLDRSNHGNNRRALGKEHRGNDAKNKAQNNNKPRRTTVIEERERE